MYGNNNWKQYIYIYTIMNIYIYTYILGLANNKIGGR